MRKPDIGKMQNTKITLSGFRNPIGSERNVNQTNVTRNRARAGFHRGHARTSYVARSFLPPEEGRRLRAVPRERGKKKRDRNNSPLTRRYSRARCRARTAITSAQRYPARAI